MVNRETELSQSPGFSCLGVAHRLQRHIPGPDTLADTLPGNSNDSHTTKKHPPRRLAGVEACIPAPEWPFRGRCTGDGPVCEVSLS